MTGIEVTVLVLVVMTIVFICALGHIITRLDTNRGDIRSLEYEVKKLQSILDVASYSDKSYRLDSLSREIEHIHDRIDKLPSEKARVVQAKVDELEKLVEGLK